MQRIDHDDWISSIIDEAKREARKVKGFYPGDWEYGAFHHQISKVTLQSLSEALQRALKSRDTDISEAAKRFWKMVQNAASQEVVERASGEYTKVFWNMLVNLELGPQNISNNPGIGFDPNTEPIPGDQNGARRLTKESALLYNIEETYQKKCAEDRQKESKKRALKSDDILKFEAEEWDAMAAVLEQAAASYDERAGKFLLARPLTEQWAQDGERFQRKGLRRFPGIVTGRKRFVESRQGGQEDIAAYQDDETVAVTYAEPLSVKNELYQITVQITNAALYHCCERHTYQHFNREKTNVVNAFWPLNKGRSIANISGLAHQVAPFIAGMCAEYIKNSDSDPDQWQDTDLKAANVSAGAEKLFFYTTLEAYFDETQGDFTGWLAKVETFAPDAESGEAYTAEELGRILENL